MLVGRVDLYRAALSGFESQNFRTQERSVMEVDDVIALAIEKLANALLL